MGKYYEQGDCAAKAYRADVVFSSGLRSTAAIALVIILQLWRFGWRWIRWYGGGGGEA